MNKFKYLIKVNSSFNIIKAYLKYSLFSHFEKKKRKEFNNNYKNFFSKKKHTYDFFSQNTFDWVNILYEFKEKDFKYLEIGSFEGNSALFVLENYKNSFVYCVDSWIQFYKKDGRNEGYEDKSIKKIEDNFDENLSSYKDRFKKYKMKSDIFFNNNKDFFDVTYVDGSHLGEDVIKDCRGAWTNLKKNGILILDDYFWQNYNKIKDNPAYAINNFLKEISDEYKIIRLSKFQLFLRKLY